jgi:DNA-binding protein
MKQKGKEQKAVKVTNKVKDNLCKKVKFNKVQMERRGSHRWG